MATMDRDAKAWLQPMLSQLSGPPVPDGMGGWNVNVSAPGGKRLKLDTAWTTPSSVYKKTLFSTKTAKTEPTKVGSKVVEIPVEAGRKTKVTIPTAPRTVIPKGATVSMIGGAVVDFAVVAGAAVDFIAALTDADAEKRGVKRSRYSEFKQDQRFAANVVVAAVMAMTEVKPRLKARSMTRTANRNKSWPRVRIHGMSRQPKSWNKGIAARIKEKVVRKVADAIKSATD